MPDIQAHPVQGAGALLPTHAAEKQVPPHMRPWIPWNERIKHFSWQWHGVVTGTAVTSSILHLFPYHNDSQGLKIVALVVFLIALVVFTFNLIAKIWKVILFPKDSLTHITDPAKSSFSGFLAVGGAGLIDAGVNVSKDWHTGKNGFLFALYGLWWLDAAVAYFTAFGVIYFIMGQKSRDVGKVMAIWIIPVVSLIASSTCGGLLADALSAEFPGLALITTSFAITMGIVGLSFTTMITFGLLLRLFLHGAPEGNIALATFNSLTPLGQGGFSLLINGANFAHLLPVTLGADFPQIALAGQIIYGVCFCFSYILWCMGLAWIMLSCFSIFRRFNKLPRFSVVYWSVVFPNGTFALLSVQLGNVLQSRFYHGFGAAWSIIVFTMWTILVIRGLPAFFTGHMFLPPGPPAKQGGKKHKKHQAQDAEKAVIAHREPTHSPSRSTLIDDNAAAAAAKAQDKGIPQVVDIAMVPRHLPEVPTPTSHEFEHTLQSQAWSAGVDSVGQWNHVMPRHPGHAI